MRVHHCDGKNHERELLTASRPEAIGLEGVRALPAGKQRYSSPPLARFLQQCLQVLERRWRGVLRRFGEHLPGPVHDDQLREQAADRFVERRYRGSAVASLTSTVPFPWYP